MNITKTDQPLRPWQHCVVFLVACLISITRRPDAVFHAQFYAEDGRVWFANAYNLGGFAALLHPQDGYFQTLPRLGAAIALLAPFLYAPLVLNLIAIFLMALPVNLLLASRSSGWGSLRFRVILGAIYLVLPNSGEIRCGITESQWVLALIAFLIVVASPPRSMATRVFHLAILLLCGLTGPFGIFFLPIALFLAWRRRTRWYWAMAAIFSAATLIQTWAFFIKDPGSRHTIIAGANLEWFIRILSGSVFMEALLGGNEIGLRPGTSTFILLVCVFVAGIAVAGCCAAKANEEMRLFLYFSAMIFAGTLIVPKLYPIHGFTFWQELTFSPGIHYWFFPTLAFAWSLIWCAHQQKQAFRIISVPLLFLMCIGLFRDWKRPAFADLKFAEYSKRLESAAAGTVVVIPENPAGWDMRLIKH